jgi:hypothetical protein
MARSVELRLLVHLAGIDLSGSALRRVARLISAHRRGIDSQRRQLVPGRQALLVLAHLRCRSVMKL